GKHSLIKLMLMLCMLISLFPSAVKVRAEEEIPLPMEETSGENQESNSNDDGSESQNPIQLPSGGYEIRTRDVNIEHDGWKATLKNLDWYYTVEPHFSLDFSSGKTVLGFIPVPDLKFDLTFKIGVKGDFSVEITKANLPDNMDIQSRVDSLTKLYSEKISDSLFDYLPSYYGFGFDMEAFFVAGASGPIKAKGKFSNIADVKISTDGITTDYDPVFEYTSVIPQEPDTPTFIYVGSVFNEDINVGEVGYRSATIGPIAKGRTGFMAGGKSVATLHRDEWSCNNSYLNDSITSIHSCTEVGKDGCVDGEVMQNYEFYEDFVIDLTLPLIDYNVYNKTINIDNVYRQYSRRPFVQSLTYKENLKYREICDHMYYKVPVAVWADREMTMPLSGVYVHKEGFGEVDANVAQFAYGKTGSNPTITVNHDGRANLYLPYVNGRHTVVADENYSDSKYKGMGGKAQMSSDMVRGANDTVNIILESKEKIDLSVEKVWDIDLENKDKPSSIEVLLQAQYYNTGFLKWNGIKKAELDSINDWSYTFRDLPKYEITPEGKIHEIKYRIRELAPAKEGGQPEGNDGEEDPISWIVGYIDGLLKPDDGPMAADSARVVPSRWDLDNTHVWEQLKKRVTDWNELWKLEPSTAWLKTLAKDSLFPNPTVDYKVKAYTTIVGDREEDHTTRYWVTYDVEGTHTKITNTAMLDVNMYK
ncbi:MAG: Cna B-type domain-containing protein, partial [Erysipelotrichaceae bacterium]|nr:Cna B-type domain-containing protein [Erysipelotrichaceae bacterium]